MKTSVVFAALAALCVSSAEASALVRVRTLSTQHKSQSGGRFVRDSFLDVDPTFRRLELEGSMSMSVSMSESLSMPGSLSMPADDVADIDTTPPEIVYVEGAEKESSG
jgi:hypothetical protein